jgi:HEAT repeat protein
VYYADSIVRALGIIGSPAAVDVLSGMLDESGGVGSLGGSRAEHPVAEALGKIGTKEAVEALARNAHKEGVSGALSRAGEEGTAALRRTLDSGTAEQRAGAARTLGEARDKGAVPGIVKIFETPHDERTWRTALDALLGIGDASVVPALLAAWRKLPAERETGEAWLQFGEVVAKLGGANAVPDLLGMTAAAPLGLEGDMKAAIVGIGEPAIPALAQALQTGKPEVQKLAAELIADIKGGRGRESGNRGMRRY